MIKRLLLKQCDEEGMYQNALLPTYHCMHTPGGPLKYSLEGHRQSGSRGVKLCNGGDFLPFERVLMGITLTRTLMWGKRRVRMVLFLKVTLTYRIVAHKKPYLIIEHVDIWMEKNK